MYDDIMHDYRISGIALVETREMLESYEDKSASELFYCGLFEESNSSNSEEPTKAGIGGTLMKAITALKNMIGKVIESIKTFIQTIFMDKEERKRFAAFKEAMKNDPSLAKKKLTVANFKAIEKANREAMSVVDDALKNATGRNESEIAAIEKECTDKINAILKGTSDTAKVVVTADVALRLAESNKNAAKIMSSMLGDESKAMDYLQSQIGDTRATKFKNKINSCSHTFSLHRMKTRLLFQWHKGLVSSTKQVLNDIQDVVSLKPGKIAKHTSMVDDALGSINTKTGKNIKKRDVVNFVKGTKAEIRDAKRGVNELKRNAENTFNKVKKNGKAFGKWINS